jgi:hypothetical protein
VTGVAGIIAVLVLAVVWDAFIPPVDHRVIFSGGRPPVSLRQHAFDVPQISWQTTGRASVAGGHKEVGLGFIGPGSFADPPG